MNFQVSVIIPVYNAEPYIRKAVESAVHLNEVVEVILVEDKSPDNALFVCRQLESEYSKVRLLQHPNGENRGAGASRNLGIEKASYEYLAFLDADDFFLPDRFLKTQSVFELHPDADGVYDAIGYFKEGDEHNYKLFTVSKQLNPSALFHYLIRGTYGHFSTIGVTVKKSVFNKAGVFDVSLKLHQDTEMWLRLSFHGSLYSGELQKPVALARKHEQNRITHANYESKLQYWQIVLRYYSNKKIGLINRLLIKRKIAAIKSQSLRKSFLILFLKELFH
jgi:glycosyltransferase involved in cell wall biosynthesis